MPSLRLAALCFSFLLVGCESLSLLDSEASPARETEHGAAVSSEEFGQIDTLHHGGANLEASDKADAATARIPVTTSSAPPTITRAELTYPVGAETQSDLEIKPLDPVPPSDLFNRMRSGFQLDHRLDHPRVKSQAA